MADDFDVEALLEAPYRKEMNCEGKTTTKEPIRNGEIAEETKSSDKTKDREKSTDQPPASKSRHRSRSPHRSRSKRRSKSKHRSKSPPPPGRSRSKRRSKTPRKRSKSPRKRSQSPRKRSKSPRKRSQSPRKRSKSPRKRSKSPRKPSQSPPKRNKSPRKRSKSPRKRSKSPRKRSKSPRKRSKSPRKRSKSPRKPSKSPRKRSKSPRKRSKSPRKPSKSPRKRSKSPRKRSKSPRKRSKSPRKRSKSPRKRSKTPRKSSKSPPKRSQSNRRSRSRHRTRSRERPPPPPPKRRSRTRSKDRKRRRKSLTPISLPGRREGIPPPNPRYRKTSPVGKPPPAADDLTPEERDARTIFCMQLSQRIRAKDIEEFFSSVGKVRDVKLITCNKTRRFKGISYVEFKDPESVALAIGLNGQKLLGIPIVVQPTQAEKNRIGNSLPNLMPRNHPGPVRLYVGSLHYNITEDMLRGIFEPFGKIDSIQLMTDPETGRSKGYGFVTYHNSEDAKKALEQMNGFELAGRPMKVNNVTDRNDFNSTGPGIDETDERPGIDLGATGRLQLMYKLAEGTGMQIPAAAASALNLNQPAPIIPQATPAPPIATQCFLLANMFDPNSESAPSWEVEIKDDVIEECNKHGGCVHVYVDRASPQGNVYVKCSTITTAVASVNSLHGRWFGGRVITAAYVPVLNYHNLFPETIAASAILMPSRKSAM